MSANIAHAIKVGSLEEPDPYMDLPQVIESCFALYRHGRPLSETERERLVRFVQKATDMIFGLREARAS